MAAPSGTVWGSIVGGYGRIGIYTSVSNIDETKASLTAEIWFWSKYSVSDSTNTLYYDMFDYVGSASTSRGSKSISTTVASGDGWSTSNQVKIAEWGKQYSRTTSAQKMYIYAKLANVDRVGGTMYASTTFTIPTLTSYTITYNANGGSNAPSKQTKWYGKSINLSTSTPTRTGYSFQGWATSASGSVVYASGAAYTGNASLSLYAVWKANTYTVSYNANGGSGTPGNQIKTHGTTLKLSSLQPTRTNYTFLGWATSKSATTAAYAAGGNYTANSAVTLYAVWALNYVKPIIHSLTANRCDANGTATDTGTCGLIKFEWETTNTVSAITIAWESTAGSGSTTVSASGTSGSVNKVIGSSALSTEVAYTITVTVTDGNGSSNAKTTLNGAIFPIDFLSGGKGVAFGKPAEFEGVAEFALEGKFNKPVYGKVLGMDRLPAIPDNSDLNNYLDPGCYAVRSDKTAATCANIPVDKAGRLEVWAAIGESVRLNEWSYLRQRYISRKKEDAVWEREITRGKDNVWQYTPWWKSSLTPEASEKVYHTQKVLWSGGYYMTAEHTATLAEPVSAQATGIILVFSYRSGNTTYDFGWNSHFVPKQLVALHPGQTHQFFLSWANTSNVATKALNIFDTQIIGMGSNNETATVSGIKFDNTKFVLRYVIGV
jgi:uncharacterized repeat protein (TIGR02543 family)